MFEVKKRRKGKGGHLTLSAYHVPGIFFVVLTIMYHANEKNKTLRISDFLQSNSLKLWEL